MDRVPHGMKELHPGKERRGSAAVAVPWILRLCKKKTGDVSFAKKGERLRSPLTLPGLRSVRPAGARSAAPFVCCGGDSKLLLLPVRFFKCFSSSGVRGVRLLSIVWASRRSARQGEVIWLWARAIRRFTLSPPTEPLARAAVSGPGATPNSRAMSIFIRLSASADSGTSNRWRLGMAIIS